MSHIGDMHAAKPDQLRALLLDHLSPAVAELLTCKLEEYAEQGDGEAHKAHTAADRLTEGTADSMPGDEWQCSDSVHSCQSSGKPCLVELFTRFKLQPDSSFRVLQGLTRLSPTSVECLLRVQARMRGRCKS